VNYQEQMQMRNRMGELRKQVDSLTARLTEAETRLSNAMERLAALESTKLKLPRKAIL
jgi:chromosome segregation ATPase